jgi:eukaryotic-like serine/threonine-protein kinase
MAIAAPAADPTVAPTASPSVDDAAPLERRVGAYRLLEEIGSGGMGEVYRAVRADETYEQEVAVKLIRRGNDTASLIQRFRNERQILATFDHPNIARLLDGGASADGRPYFVMELIAGEPIDGYCDRKRLDVTQRLRLFLEVCGAVQYAHQRLIIHRDLKPGNILVRQDGVPKLLDFGIAKILDEGGGAADSMRGMTTVRLLTPDYASPEQLRAEPMTTASDVYSLGLILYELLTGLKPGDAAGRTSRHAGNDWEPRRPSASVRLADPPATHGPDAGQRAAARQATPEALRRRLRGDLDNIVLKALRIDPKRRYQSVGDLAEDLRRHLTSQPVLARPDTFAYRTGKFLARYTAGVVASTLVGAALLAGLLVSLHERQLALEQRARAERRFSDVYKLAHSLIFEINDSIQELPGASRARHLVLETGLQYLDGLSREAAGDVPLEHEIAAAYEKLGDVQGRALEANEGDAAGAAQSYQRALALRRAMLVAEPRNPDLRREMVVNIGKLSDLMWNSGNAEDTLRYSRETVDTSASLLALDPANRKYRSLLATSRLDFGYKLFEIRGDSQRALESIGAALDALEPLWSTDPGNVRLGRTLSLAYSRAGEVFWQGPHDLAQALAMHDKARWLLEPLVAAAPDNADLAHLLAFANHQSAAVLIDMGELERAQRQERAALGAFQALAAADPAIGEYHMNVSLARAGMASIALQRGQLALSMSELQAALDEGATAAKSAGQGTPFALAQGNEERRMAEIQAAFAAVPHAPNAARIGALTAAREWYGKASATFARVREVSNEAARNVDEIAARIRDTDAALSALGAGPQRSP